MKKLLALVLSLSMLLGMAGALAEGAAYTGPDTFSMIDTFDITTLDYVYNNKSSNGDYISNFIEGLLTQDSHGKLIPGMAKEWSHNADASELTFVIRDDVTFHDGTPVTVQVGSSANDVHIVYSIFSGNEVVERGAIDQSNAL